MEVEAESRCVISFLQLLPLPLPPKNAWVSASTSTSLGWPDQNSNCSPLTKTNHTSLSHAQSLIQSFSICTFSNPSNHSTPYKFPFTQFLLPPCQNILLHITAATIQCTHITTIKKLSQGPNHIVKWNFWIS